MPTVGNTSKPTSSAEGWGLNVTNHFGQLQTMPSGGPWRITAVGAWFAGWNSTVQYRLCVWSAAGTLLGQTGLATAGSGGNIGQHNSSLHTGTLITPVEVNGGQQVFVGFARNPSHNVQLSTYSSGQHYERYSSSWPVNLTPGGYHNVGAMGAYIADYEQVITNRAPNAPSPSSPSNGALITSLTPNLVFTHSDPDGDPPNRYDLQVSTVSSFSSTVWSITSQTSGISGNTITRAYAGPALNRGTTYYWRARTRDAGGLWGPWSSSSRNFKIARVPTSALASPSASNVAAPLYYDAGSNVVPRFRLSHTFSCPDGGTQTQVVYRIYLAGGALQHTHTANTSATTRDITGFNPTNGTKYDVSVETTCSHGLSSGESAKRAVQARWGRASYRVDLGQPPLTLAATMSATPNSGQVILEYASSSVSTPQPSTFIASIASVEKQRYVWYRATLLPQPVASPTSPRLNSITFSYSNNVLAPDDWDMAGMAVIDAGTYVYGTLSLKHLGHANVQITRQTIEVTPETDYILSGRMKVLGNMQASLRLTQPGQITALVEAAAPSVTTPWRRFVSPIWNSGGTTEVDVIFRTSGAVGTAAWVDAIKVEASHVVTPWTPGFLGDAVVLDAGGVMVDRTKGGVFRLRAGDGSIIELGETGLTGAAGTPTGVVMPFVGATTDVPAGFLICRGGTQLIANYPALHAVIGTKFGGDGVTTFGIPDLRRRFPMGAQVNADVGNTGGDLDHTHTSAAHTHALSAAGWAQARIDTGNIKARQASVSSWSPTSSRQFSDGGAGSAASEPSGITLNGLTDSRTPAATGSNNPPYVEINYIIKT